jgi:hypothetical protein
MKNFLLIAGVLLAQVALGQRISVKGTVTDTLSAPLPSATVVLLNPKDSTLVNFGATKADGSFELRNVVQGEYIMKVTFVAFRTHTQKISATDPSGIHVGTIRLRPQTTKMTDVEISADRIPVTIKKDTVEFDAMAFKTQQNANVEDLLKRLPGVEVESDGTIKAQGETIRRVMVDGKEFFGNDPKLATRNLPAAAIDKVQLYDRLSDQSQFTGIDDGQREKTINLTLKEEYKNGGFGNMMAGYGTDDRFQAKGNFNKFSKNRQLSLLGMGNNINEQGFSIDDYINFSGGLQQLGGGAGGGRGGAFVGGGGAGGLSAGGIPISSGARGTNGIMSTYAGGINSNNQLNKNTELNGSYFLNHIDHAILRDLERENFLPSGNFLFNQSTNQSTSNTGHRANAVLDHKLDSANSFRWTTNLNYSENTANIFSTSGTRNSEGELQNDGERLTRSESTGLNFTSSLLFRHRFAKKGRTFSSTLDVGLSRNDSEGDLMAENNFYGNDPRTELLQQINDQTSQFTSLGGNFSYTEPLGGRKYLEANYTYRQNLNKVNREVYDMENEEMVFNNQLSNRFNSDYQYHRGGVNFRVNRQNYNFTLGAAMQQTYLVGELLLTDTEIDRSFNNWLPSAQFNYSFTSSKNLRVNYQTSVQEPTVQQLQPIVDNSDPLNIYVGNPELKPAYSHRLTANYNSFNMSSMINFFSAVNVIYSSNVIANGQSIDENFVRTTRPENMDEGLTFSGNANFGFPIRKLNGRVNLSGNLVHSMSQNFLNEEVNTINRNVAGGRIRYDYRLKEFLNLNVGSNLSYTETIYTFQNALNQSFLNETHTAEAILTVKKNYQFTSNFSYMRFQDLNSDFDERIPLFNLTFSRFFLKNNSGELKISANNLLDRNIGVNQRADVNFFERETTNALGRFYMISFTYSLNKHMNPMGGGNMRRSFRMMGM